MPLFVLSCYLWRFNKDLLLLQKLGIILDSCICSECMDITICFKLKVQCGLSLVVADDKGTSNERELGIWCVRPMNPMRSRRI